jgi:hypothetical protein
LQEQKYHNLKDFKMQIRTLEGIVEGKLVNSPSISFISQISTLPKKINEGDLFISSNLDDIKVALENGAFAIIYDFDIDTKHIDDEIAWIKVKSIKKATLKLIRFILIAQDTNSYYCDDIVFELIKILTTNKKNIKLLSGNIIEDFEILRNITTEDMIFSNNKEYIYNISPMSEDIQTVTKYNIQNLTIHSIFKTSFSYNGFFYNYIKLPYLYMKQFLTLIDFIDINNNLNIDIDISLLRNMKFFSPIFIDNYYKITDFGKSNRFIIASIDKKLAKLEIDFIKNYYNFAKIYAIKNYKNDKELIEKIGKKSKFNALYIIGKSKLEVEYILKDAQKEQNTLF